MEEVTIKEEEVIIPTYEVGAPDKNPMFLEKRVYQGSSGKIYPYPTTQEISREKKNHAWKAVWLENQYLKVMILPELGGRIQRAYDKTNNYDFVYYNHVIKPALVGLTGPWISGGIEFNWPQHHRPTTFLPVDYQIRENEDGSKTLLTGDVDQMYGTKEVTSFTLYPDKAYIEIRGQLYNRTPCPQTFLWWANPAVSVNENTQSIFPPDVHNVYDHGKRAVSRFPIATGTYYKHDYSEGVDISRYKNIPVPTSYMAERSKFDFVGGYDYGKKAGLLHVADHHVSPGKKQWTWGCGDFGKAWDRGLTDEDGPYVELMTGVYCDNQPDFSWLAPFEEKTFKQYFMPYKEVGPVKNATINAVLNVEKREKGLYVCVYATSRYVNARLRVTDGGKDVFEKEIRISPTEIFEETLPIQIKDICKIKVSVSYGGEDLVSYQAEDPGMPEIAEPARAPERPEKMRTIEELYLTGQHIEQYRHATWLPDDYYLEGLKRDPDDSRINNAYGLLLMRRGRFTAAEKYFRTAIRRLTSDGMFNNPYDSEAFYNLGLSLFFQERYDEAYDAFYKASWKNEEEEMSFYFLAALAARKGKFRDAIDFADRSLTRNAHSVKARGLKAVLLRKCGRTEEAGKLLMENLALDLFDFVSRFEMGILGSEEGLLTGPERDYKDSWKEDFHRITRDFHETYLQTARDYAEWGFYEEAVAVLHEYPGEKPMIHYYLGDYLDRLGRETEAMDELCLAEKSDPKYTFPNKPEDIGVLRHAITKNPKGARAYYYLGCLCYDKLCFREAIECFEHSKDLDGKFPTLLRNLSIAYYNKAGKKKEALSLMEEAFALDPTDARVFLELDWLCQKMQIPKDKRLQNYERNIDLIEKRDDLYIEYVTLLNLCGYHKKAYEKIASHIFRTWEGAEGKVSAQFKTALLEMAKEEIQKQDYKKAKSCLEEALSYPANLGEGRLEGTRDNHLYYYSGLCWEKLGDQKKARACYEKAALGAMEVAGVMYYYDQPADMILYQGLALQKLGRQGEANARFYALIDYGERHIHDKFRMDYFAVSMPDMSVFDSDMDAKNKAHCYYVCGLGYLGLGRKGMAAEFFDKVLAMDCNHQNACDYRKMCG
jgi:tetratricopeptide (TPR) repeat protein